MKSWFYEGKKLSFLFLTVEFYFVNIFKIFEILLETTWKIYYTLWRYSLHCLNLYFAIDIQFYCNNRFQNFQIDPLNENKDVNSSKWPLFRVKSVPSSCCLCHYALIYGSDIYYSDKFYFNMSTSHPRPFVILFLDYMTTKTYRQLWCPYFGFHDSYHIYLFPYTNICEGPKTSVENSHPSTSVIPTFIFYELKETTTAVLIAL